MTAAKRFKTVLMSCSAKTGRFVQCLFTGLSAECPRCSRRSFFRTRRAELDVRCACDQVFRIVEK